MPRAVPLLAAAVTALAACAASAPRAPAPDRAASLAIAGDAPAQTAPPQPPREACALASGLPPLPVPDLERSSPGVAPPKSAESQKNLRAWIDTLADPALRGRSAGSPENKRVAALLAGAFASFGLRPPRPHGDHCLPFELGGVRDQNVVAHLGRGGGPALIVGAHYDSQGVDAQGRVYPGADDNASGVAALLEIARIVSEGKGLQGKDLVFVAFGAEERGILGARAFVADPTVPLAQVRLMVNLDMVGRPLLTGDAIGYIAGGRDKERTLELLEMSAARADRPTVGIPEAVMTTLGFASDSVPFGPHTSTLFLSTSIHADYHKPTDTPEKIDLDQIALTVRMVVSILEGA